VKEPRVINTTDSEVNRRLDRIELNLFGSHFKNYDVITDRPIDQKDLPLEMRIYSLEQNLMNKVFAKETPEIRGEAMEICNKLNKNWSLKKRIETLERDMAGLKKGGN